MSQHQLVLRGYTPYSVAWSASMRHRLVHYRQQLQAAGIRLELVEFATPLLERVLYRSGQSVLKLTALMQALIRWLPKALKSSDLVFIQREATLLGPPLVERLQARSAALVFDFDDAIWLSAASKRNGRLINSANKTIELLRLCDLALPGNPFLAAFAAQHTAHSLLMPTTIDCATWRPQPRQPGPPRIGWIGSHSTARYLSAIAPALSEALSGRKAELLIVGAGSPSPLPGLAARELPWRLWRERADFARLDIGLYPLEDSLWEQGKCAFKAIQYGAMGVPVICSPVGYNAEVVSDGVTGLYARTHAEWAAAVTRLLDDPELRTRLGAQARAEIAARFDAQDHGRRLATALRDTYRRWCGERATECAA